MMSFSPEVRKKLEDQGYRLVGGHSAVKLCHWLKEGLQDNPGCYKQRFYGIDSHRCVQMTPSVATCNQKCLFCWRSYEHWTETDFDSYDPAPELLEKIIDAQKQLLTGFGGSPEKYPPSLVEEAMQPRHLAISLSGEPTLYPDINKLIQTAHEKDITTFLVTNGQEPEMIKDLVQPTQLYVSLDAPDPQTYKKVCRPEKKEGWQKLMKTLKYLSRVEGRTAIRITLVKDINDHKLKRYAEHIEKADPDYIEVKAYMHIGSSRKRLKRDRMPSNQEIKEFSRKIMDKTNYEIESHVPESRVTLLTKNKEPKLQQNK